MYRQTKIYIQYILIYTLTNLVKAPHSVSAGCEETWRNVKLNCQCDVLTHFPFLSLSPFHFASLLSLIVRAIT